MDPTTRMSAQVLRINSRLYKRALEGLAREELLRRSGPNSNPMIWLTGHLVLARNGLANILGLQRKRPWEEVFGRGIQVSDQVDYPSMEDILAAWQDVTKALKERIDSITDAELSVACVRKFPIDDTSVRGGLAFLACHESYHVGQMAYLRKWLGRPGLTG